MNETVKKTLEGSIAELTWEIEQQREYVSNCTRNADKANIYLQQLLTKRRELQDHLAVHA